MAASGPTAEKHFKYTILLLFLIISIVIILLFLLLVKVLLIFFPEFSILGVAFSSY